MELGHVVLTQVAGLRPSAHLTALFAADVVMRLPEDGWVLDARQVWRWIEALSVPADWSPVELPEPTRPPARWPWLSGWRRAG
jgi:hypothetical protein